MSLSAASNMMNQITSKERDAETGLDYFGARYYSGAQGRFTSPDPLLNSGRPTNPQSWNRYAYTLNNPLRYVDPTGLYEWAASVCSAGDKDCENEYKDDQQEFRDSLTYLKMSRDSFDKKSNEYKRLNAARKAYGKRSLFSNWSGHPDLNWGLPAPKAGALPGCAMPRQLKEAHSILIWANLLDLQLRMTNYEAIANSRIYCSCLRRAATAWARWLC